MFDSFLANDTGHEMNVLERLSAFVVFAGRYPIPTNWEQSLPRVAPDGRKVVPHFFSKADFVTAELLENRFRTVLLRAAYNFP